MDIFEKQNHLNNLKDAKDSFYKNYKFYKENIELLDQIINNLEKNMEGDLLFIKSRSKNFANKLKLQDLEIRKNFVELNKFNEYDITLLSGLLQSQIANNIPVLELFPGSGQFLPFVVSAEPLYIADRYIEICIDASKTLNNEFFSTRRLRKYEVKNDISENLPLQSFGLIYCFNEFFMADEDYILETAKQVFKLLYDGGKFIFNFMPHDQFWAQQMAVNNMFTIVDYKSIINELTLLGYVITAYEIRQLKSSYIIAQKSGEPKPRHKISGGWAEIIDL